MNVQDLIKLKNAFVHHYETRKLTIIAIKQHCGSYNVWCIWILFTELKANVFQC